MNDEVAVMLVEVTGNRILSMPKNGWMLAPYAAPRLVDKNQRSQLTAMSDCLNQEDARCIPAGKLVRADTTLPSARESRPGSAGDPDTGSGWRSCASLG
jgi:hypothetical protein